MHQFWPLLLKINFCRGGCTLACVSIPIWDFIILDFMSRQTCDEWNLPGNTVNCKNVMPVIVWKFFIKFFFTSFTIIQICRNYPILAKYIKIYQINPTNCSWNFSNFNFWPKGNMQNRAYKKLFNLKPSRNSFCLYFH